MEIRRFILGSNDCLAGNHHTNNASLAIMNHWTYAKGGADVPFIAWHLGEPHYTATVQYCWISRRDDQLNQGQVMFVYDWERENCPLYGVAECQLFMNWSEWKDSWNGWNCQLCLCTCMHDANITSIWFSAAYIVTVQSVFSCNTNWIQTLVECWLITDCLPSYNHDLC